MRISAWGILSIFVLLMACGPKKEQPIGMSHIPGFGPAYYDSVLQWLDKKVQENPQEAAWLYEKARLHNKVGEYKEAAAEAQRAVALDTGQVDYYFPLIAALYQLGDIPSARKWFDKAESLAGGSTALRLWEARMAIAREDYTLAIDNANAVLSQDPNNQDCHMIKANAYLARGDTVLALNNLDEATNIRPDKSVYNMLFNIHLELGNHEKALAYLQKNITSFPQDTSLIFQKGRFFSASGQLDSALAIFRMLDSKQAWEEVIQMKYEAKQYEAVIDYANQLLARDSSSQTALLYLARSHDKRWRYDQAKDYYTHFLAENPDHESAKEELAYLNRKIAYLQRKKQEALAAKDSVNQDSTKTNQLDTIQ